VIHLWVDPRFGSDALAVQQNPGPNAAPGSLCLPNQTAPNSVLDPNQNNAVLLHASWPFKTVTAAVAYIRSINPAATQPLPYLSPVTGISWEYAIIHCLPGVYSKALHYPDNGIQGNGETFPIELPNRVSIQGTSALNTLFDLRGDEDPNNIGPIFQFGVMRGNEPIAGEDCFISTVSLTGARDRHPDSRASCAVLLEKNIPASPTFTNCFLFKNEIGVLVTASNSGDITHDGTTFFHNTFAFNRCGLWNGQVDQLRTLPPSSRGLSELIVVNNIFDASDTGTSALNDCRVKTWGSTNFGGQACGFIGVCAEDMEVVSPIPMGVTPGPETNYNAWEYVLDTSQNPPVPVRFNDVNVVVASLPNCAIRPGSTQPVVGTGRDLQPYTGFQINGSLAIRGITFVRDLLCNTIFGRGDQSPMDFRLAPAHALAANSYLTPSLRNLLVDNGWGTGLATDFPLLMSNGLTLASRPGTLVLFGNSAATWSFSALLYDCEGHGNPRYFDHPAYAAASPGSFGVADIGADELGDLIIPGYLYGTTSFVHLPIDSPAHPFKNNQSQSSSFFNDALAHLGLPDVLNGSQPPPGGVARLGFSSNQFQPPLNDYDLGLWTGTWRFMGQNPNHTYGYTYYSPAPFEVVPHLLPDAHPWWTLALPGFPTNPVWQWCLLPGSYNRFLYVDPVAPVVNPPGSYLGTTNARWLDAFLGLSAIAAVTAFDYQDSGCQLQQWAIGGGFDPWGFGVDSFGDTMQFLCPQFNTRMSSGQCSSNKRLDTYPHHPTTPSPVGLRLTVERVLWGANNGGAIWSGSLADNNAQSFSVLIEGASQYTPSCPR